MKNLLSKIQYVFLVIWYFIIGTESKSFVSPPNEPAPTPLEKGVEDNHYDKWDISEIIVAIFLIKYDTLELLGFTDDYISACIGRTSAATIRKGYRSISKGKKNENSLESNLLYYFDNKHQDLIIRTFYRNLIVASKNSGTGVEDYFIDRLKDCGEIFSDFSNQEQE